MKDDIFLNIDSKEKAYWLGFLFADGFVNKRSSFVRLCISKKDEKHLDRFIEFVGGDFSDKKYYGPYKTSGKQVHFTIKSLNIVGDLRKYGCTYKKSKNIRFPKRIDSGFYDPFLMGVYDGDGVKSKGCSVITSGSFDFLSDIKSIFNIKNKIRKTKNKYITYDLCIGREVYENIVNSIPFCPLKSGNFKGITSSNDKEAISKKISEGLLSVKRTCSPKRKFEVEKETLKDLISKNTIIDIAKMFDVSDNAIRKRAKFFDLEYKKYKCNFAAIAQR